MLYWSRKWVQFGAAGVRQCDHAHTQINEIKRKLEVWVRSKRRKEEAHVGAWSRVLVIIDLVQPKTSTTRRVSTATNQDGPRKRVSPQRQGSTTSYLCTAVRQMCQHPSQVPACRSSRKLKKRAAWSAQPERERPRCRSINEHRQCLLHKRGQTQAKTKHIRVKMRQSCFCRMTMS